METSSRNAEEVPAIQGTGERCVRPAGPYDPLRRMIAAAALGATLALCALAAEDEPLTTTEKLHRLDTAFPPGADKKGRLRNVTREALVRETEPLDEFRAFLDEPGYAVVELSATWCGPCRSSYRAYASFAGRTDARYGMLVIDEDILGDAANRLLHSRFGKDLKLPAYYVFCDMEAVAPPVHSLEGLRSTLARVMRKPCRQSSP